MSLLWDRAGLCAATGGTLAVETAVTGVSIDSRSIGPGELFVALRDARDGHDFVADALARGAVAAMVDRDPPGVPARAPLLRVTETLQGLAALGAAGRARTAARVVAVTGSVGKTTTKEMLRTALAALGPAHASVASYNNHWGVPLTLARMPAATDFAVIEIGMNHRGEIAPLSRLARPHAAIVTNIGTAHIGNLGSQQAIAEEKSDIFVGLEPGGIAVYPADSAFADVARTAAARADASAIGFGETSGEARLLRYDGTADGGEAELDLAGQRLTVTLGAPGKHMALNACAVLAVINALGLDVARAAAALTGFGAGAGRGLRRPISAPGGEALLLDESYNASNASIRAALAVLAAQPAQRRIAVLGDMRELGEHAEALHAELAPDVAAVADLAFTCGAHMRLLHDHLPVEKRGAHAADSTLLAPLVKQALRAGDAVLVKGSLGSRMAVVVRALTEPLP